MLINCTDKEKGEHVTNIMASILRLKVQPSNCFVAQAVYGRAFFDKVERCDYLSAIDRLPFISRNGFNPRRTASHYRHFSQSTSLLVESSRFPKMKLDRLPSSSLTSTTLNPSNKKSRQMVENIYDKCYKLPKQSSITTRILFQIIAPHMEFRILTQLINRLSKIELDQRDRAGKEQALEKMLNSLFEVVGHTNLDDLTTVKYTPSIKVHSWIRPVIHSFFMGESLEMPNQEGADLSYQKNPTYPPNRIGKQYQKNLHTLIEARHVSLRRSATVEKGPSSSERQLHLEAEGMLNKLSSNLPHSHFINLLEKLRGLTTLHEKIKQKDPSSWWIDNDNNRRELNNEEVYETSLEMDYTRILCKALTTCSPTHSHLVADDFAKYFHLDLPKSQSTLMNMNEKKEEKTNRATSDTSSKIEAADMVKHQKEIFMIEKKYDRRKEKFVNEMLGLQHIFATWGENLVCKDAGANDVYPASTIEIENRSDDDDTFDLSVKEFKKAQEPYNLQTRKEQKEQLKGTLGELRKLGLEKEKEGVENRKGKGRGRPKKGNHIRFTAIRMKDKDASSPSILEEKDTHDERIVFLNNLPIDTTEEEIDSIYSRCGKLESIQLFNLRPDLDPGPLSAKQLKERLHMKKFLRKRNTFASQRRPRTPVYAILRFQTDAGYQIATSQELCIFGCVVRRHPVLSIKYHDVNTLYLEQIPPHLLSIDVENKLSELLYHRKFSLMLDGTLGLGLNGHSKESDASYQEYSQPSSCQIRFVDYSSAAQAYQWIREERHSFSTNGSNTADELDGGLQVHWFQTPSNSMDYWTRDLSF